MLCAYAGVGWSRSWGWVGIELQVSLMSALLLNSVLPVVIFFLSAKVPEPKQMTRIYPVLGFRTMSLKRVGEMAQWLRTLVALA